MLQTQNINFTVHERERERYDDGGVLEEFFKCGKDCFQGFSSMWKGLLSRLLIHTYTVVKNFLCENQIWWMSCERNPKPAVLALLLVLVPHSKTPQLEYQDD